MLKLIIVTFAILSMAFFSLNECKPEWKELSRTGTTCITVSQSADMRWGECEQEKPCVFKDLSVSFSGCTGIAGVRFLGQTNSLASGSTTYNLNMVQMDCDCHHERTAEFLDSAGQVIGTVTLQLVCNDC